jgi:PHD/YefM family antitoxin component YafN of YafNO toxin-antitoxin module
MKTLTVGIREFRDNLASYVLESKKPVAITRHGDTVGFYLPVPRKRTEEQKAAYKQTMDRWDEMLASKGIEEDDILEDFKRWRKEQRA